MKKLAMGAGSSPFSHLRTIHPTDFINSSRSILFEDLFKEDRPTWINNITITITITIAISTTKSTTAIIIIIIATKYYYYLLSWLSWLLLILSRVFPRPGHTLGNT